MTTIWGTPDPNWVDPLSQPRDPNAVPSADPYGDRANAWGGSGWNGWGGPATNSLAPLSGNTSSWQLPLTSLRPQPRVPTSMPAPQNHLANVGGERRPWWPIRVGSQVMNDQDGENDPGNQMTRYEDMTPEQLGQEFTNMRATGAPLSFGMPSFGDAASWAVNQIPYVSNIRDAIANKNDPWPVQAFKALKMGVPYVGGTNLLAPLLATHALPEAADAAMSTNRNFYGAMANTNNAGRNFLGGYRDERNMEKGLGPDMYERDQAPLYKNTKPEFWRTMYASYGGQAPWERSNLDPHLDPYNSGYLGAYNGGEFNLGFDRNFNSITPPGYRGAAQFTPEQPLSDAAYYGGTLSESVREVYVFKHSFLSMRRIDAKSRKARAVLVRFSKSLASRRHLPSQANVLSTTHRLGMTSKPTAVSDRLTISVSKWGKIFFRAWSNTGPWYPPSAKSFFRNGNLPNKVPRTRTPPSRSWILAGCTMACTNRPTVSTRMWRFLPLIFLPAS